MQTPTTINDLSLKYLDAPIAHAVDLIQLDDTSSKVDIDALSQEYLTPEMNKTFPQVDLELEGVEVDIEVEVFKFKFKIGKMLLSLILITLSAGVGSGMGFLVLQFLQSQQ